MFKSKLPKYITARAKVALVGVSLIVLSACDGKATLLDGDVAPPTANIVETAVEAGTFNTLAAALQATGLDTVLADESRLYTVFAPTDDAFAALGSDAVNGLLADPEKLKDILLYHVISGSSVGSDAAISLAGTDVQAANGSQLAISLQGDKLFINDAQVTTADVGASNGVIHVIDSVLIPAADGTSAGGMNGGTSGGTSGGMNGNEQGGGQGGDSSESLPNLVDTALAAGNFNTLAAALQATGLDSVLTDPDSSYTVFAPTDAAFAALGQDTIDALLADPDTLKNILLYHVVGGSVDASSAVALAGSTVTSANGEDFALSVNSGDLFVNLSKVTATDIFASNGVIHVIDVVLTPPTSIEGAGSIVDVAVSDGRFSTLVSALQATHLDAVLADHDEVFTVFAPTDDAFHMLGDDAVKTLLDDLPALEKILLTHVVSGAVVDSVSAYAKAGDSVTTASGSEVDLSIRDGALFVRNAKIIIFDIKAANGIIHVIDAVIQ